MLGISRETVRRFVQNGTLEGVLLYEGAPMVSAGTVTISA